MERRHTTWIICAAISAIVVACGSNLTAPTAPVVVVPAPPQAATTVTSVTVTNTGTSGASFPLAAMARLSDGSTLDVTKVAARDSSDVSRATVSSTGVVTVLGDGDVDIRAIYQGVTGSAHLAVSPPKTYALSGVVSATAADGATVADARVRVLDAAGGGEPTLTNANGAFTIAALGIGRHLVEVSKTGYQIWESEIAIVDRDLHVSVTLILAAVD